MPQRIPFPEALMLPEQPGVACTKYSGRHAAKDLIPGIIGAVDRICARKKLRWPVESAVEAIVFMALERVMGGDCEPLPRGTPIEDRFIVTDGHTGLAIEASIAGGVLFLRLIPPV